MGDRGNINVRCGPNDRGVYLYSHWGGSDLPKIVRQALQRGKSRWDDTPYLTRIIFCEMLLNEAPDMSGDRLYEVLAETTGYGIDSQEGDSNHRTIVVDTAEGKVHTEFGTYTFQEYVNGFTAFQL